MRIPVTDLSKPTHGIVFIPLQGSTTIEFLSNVELKLVGQTIVGREV